ncbi:MAG: radical SAM protein [Deltaproteobacteria bacterium]|nr:radical SAM protein [Deltaproteobacteria bacterium]
MNTEKYTLEYAVFELTNKCNLRCPFCASSSGKARKNEMPAEKWETIIKEMAELGGKEITLIGGEVFLYDEWVRIAHAVKNNGMNLVIITNGLLVDEKNYDILKSLGLHVLGISIDGPDRESYRATRGVDGFDRVLSLIRKVKEDGFTHVNAITTLTRVNYKRIDDFVKLFAGTDITWQVQIANATGERFTTDLDFSVDMYEEVYYKLTELLENRSDLSLATMDDFGYYPLDFTLWDYHSTWRGCMGAKKVIGIRSNGDLLPCLSLGDDYVVGNLENGSLIEAWNSDTVFKQFREKHLHLTGFCSKCPHSLECNAGCAAMAFTSSGVITENDYCIRKIQSEKLVQDLIEF